MPFIRLAVTSVAITTRTIPRIANPSNAESPPYLKYKNSTGFPGFKLIQSNLNYNASSKNGIRSLFGGNNIYTIIWSYNHSTYGMRNNSRRKQRILLHYARNFLRYLPTTEKMITSLAIDPNETAHIIHA